MDLRQLRYFIAVAEHANISLAAQAVHIAQPALSRQMKALEEEVGALLMERTGRGVKLTDAGEQLLRDARKLLEDAESAKQRAERAGRGEIGHLSIAVPVMQSLSPMIEAVLKQFHAEAPGVALTLHHLLSDDQLKMLGEGRLDAGFLLFRSREDPLLEGIPFSSDRMVLAYPADWKWEQGRPQVLRDLQDVDFVWLPRTAAPTWHDQLIHCFFNAGFVPKAAVHGVDAGSMLSLVSAGMGCTVLPETAKIRAPKSVAFMELEDLLIRQNWELVWRRDLRSASLQRLLQIARDYVERAK